jgi:hypothetical protein
MGRRVVLMARRIWQDRMVERPRTFNVQNNGDETVTLIPAPGVIANPGTPVNAAMLNGIESDILQLQILNANYLGKSVTLNWNEQKLVNWQKFWSGPNGTGNVIKQISYAWNAQKLVESEVYLFHDYDESNQLVETRQFIVNYMWNENKLCTMIDIQEVV